jgi:DNA-binding transcriptional MocR family regulator
MMTILVEHIARASGRKYQRICNAIQTAVAAGDVQPGDRLPPQRELADTLGVTLGTVTRGYREADALGLVRGETGRGTFIVRREQEEFSLHALHNRLDRETSDLVRFDLNFPVPDGEPDLAAMLGELARDAALQELLRYQPTAGLKRHRQAACRWLARFNLPTAPEQVAITTGAQHALFAALASQLAPGEALAVDSLTYPGIINLAGVLHIRLVPVGSDAEGMRPDLLEKAAGRHRLKGVYLIPTMHNPTTVTMDAARRQELAATLRRLDLFLVEDDVYGRMERQSQTPIAVLAPERSFYLTNLSKTLAPGLRLGYLAVPEGRMPAIEEVMAASIWMNPPLMAEIGSRWIDDGTAERVIAIKRRAAERRMANLVQALGGMKLQQRPGSLHAWLALPPPWSGEAFARLASRQGVQVIPSSNFSTNERQNERQNEQGVRICIGPPKNDAEVSRGAGILADILAKPPGREILLM